MYKFIDKFAADKFEVLIICVSFFINNSLKSFVIKFPKNGVSFNVNKIILINSEL